MNWFLKLFRSRASQQKYSLPPTMNAQVESAPSNECDYDEMRHQVIQECTRIFNEALEGKHVIYKEGDKSYRIGDTKVSFYHNHLSSYYGVYYGWRHDKDEMNIKDEGLERLAFRVYAAAEESLLKLKRERDCKKMEALLRS